MLLRRGILEIAATDTEHGTGVRQEIHAPYSFAGVAALAKPILIRTAPRSKPAAAETPITVASIVTGISLLDEASVVTDVFVVVTQAKPLATSAIAFGFRPHPLLVHTWRKK